MSLQTYMFECECDHEDCKAVLIKSTADEILDAGWQVVKHSSDFSDRSWMEIDDETYCPDHHVDKGGVIIPVSPELEAAAALEGPNDG